MSIIIPPKLTSAALKRLALLCGVGRTGTKAALITRLQHDISIARVLKPGDRVLSVDLGIRNLAFSLLQARQTGQSPVLHHWQRLDLTSQSLAALSAPVAAAAVDIKPADTASTTVTAATSSAAAAAAAKDAEQFAPKFLSQTAFQLVKERLLPLKPDYILLERQRFRSGSNPSILEWTIRVNSLEGMLYATLATMKGLGHWNGEIVAMEPRSILSSLEDGVAAQKKLKMGADGLAVSEDSSDGASEGENESIKAMKIDMVGNILSTAGSEELVLADGNYQVRDMADAFLSTWNRTRRRRARSTSTAESTEDSGHSSKASLPSLKKLDDLADSLVQGITFLQWQDNTRQIQQGGEDAVYTLLGLAKPTPKVIPEKKPPPPPRRKVQAKPKKR